MRKNKNKKSKTDLTGAPKAPAKKPTPIKQEIKMEAVKETKKVNWRLVAREKSIKQVRESLNMKQEEVKSEGAKDTDLVEMYSLMYENIMKAKAKLPKDDAALFDLKKQYKELRESLEKARSEHASKDWSDKKWASLKTALRLEALADKMRFVAITKGMNIPAEKK